MEGINSGAVSTRCATSRTPTLLFRHRREHRPEPSGGGDLDEERREARRDADSSPTRAAATWRVMPPITFSSTRYRRRAPQRLLHVIVEEGLVDAEFVRDRTSGYEALVENVRRFSPEAMRPSAASTPTRFAASRGSTPRQRGR